MSRLRAPAGDQVVPSSVTPAALSRHVPVPSPSASRRALPVATFGEAHGADGRVAEDDGGDVPVVQPGVPLALEEPVRQLPAGRDGHCGEGRRAWAAARRGTPGLGRGGQRGRGTWGEEGSPADIPDSIDPCPGGVLELVHHHVALGVHPHALPRGTAAASAHVPGGTGQVTPTGDPGWWPPYSQGYGRRPTGPPWDPRRPTATSHQQGRDVLPPHHVVQTQLPGVGLPAHGPQQAVHVPDHPLRWLVAGHRGGDRHVQQPVRGLGDCLDLRGTTKATGEEGAIGVCLATGDSGHQAEPGTGRGLLRTPLPACASRRPRRCSPAPGCSLS